MSDRADREAILRLVHEYALAVDRRDIDQLVTLFVPDGRLTGFISYGRTEPDYDFVGREAIYALGTRWAPYLELWHFIGTHASQVTGDEATARSYCLAHHLIASNDALVDRVMSIVYDDIFIRTGQGWLLRSRTVRKLWSEDRPASR